MGLVVEKDVEKTNEEEHDFCEGSEEGDSDQIMKRIFEDFSGGMEDYDAPEGAIQSTYWSDGVTVVREKKSGKWVYSTEDDGR